MLYFAVLIHYTPEELADIGYRIVMVY